MPQATTTASSTTAKRSQRARRGPARTSRGAAAELAKKDTEITRLRALTTRMIASIHHPLLVVDPELRISIANDAFLGMFPGIAEGGSLTAHFNPDGLKSLVREVAETGKSRIDQQMAIGAAAGSSSERAFRVSLLPLTAPDESPLVLMTIDEMTELRLRETQLLESSRLVAVGEMTSSVAHELNNPLTAILGFSQLAMRQEMDDALARDIEAIVTEARRAGRIVDNLLSFARRRPHELQAFSPVEAVRHVLDLRRYECKVNNIEVVTYFDEETPRTVGDLHQLQQVFLNILNNAVHAISDHRAHGAISVGVVAVGSKIRITFADDGPGIPQGVTGHIFEPFYTTKAPGKGTGLGLSICKNIVESHDGTITVKSRKGGGATFTIEIPVIEPEKEDEERSLMREIVDSALPMLRVLVVDDELPLIELMKRALTGAGHEVETATDGAEAIQSLYVREYDAVLLDVKMPGLGGEEVFRCIESIRPELVDRVQFMSGDVAGPEVKTFIETTGNPLLKKPFTLDDLRRRMETFASKKVERTAV